MTSPSRRPPSEPRPTAAKSADRRELSPHQANAVAIVRELHGPRRDAIYATFAEDFRAAIPRGKFISILEDTTGTLGALYDVAFAEQEPLAEAGWFKYRVVAFFARGARLYTLSLDQDGVLHGLLIKPLAPGAAPDGKGPADGYVSKRIYTLPVRDAWLVANGGRTSKGNNHVGNQQQWYAFDLVRQEPGGRTHRGDGKKNDDYPAFAQPVVAPAEGTVITVVDGVPHNAPGEKDTYFVPGNLVVLDHGGGEHSFLAHFRRGSIVVKPGARVKQGQLLGEVGNSGNSSEPHIHWHLATEPLISQGHGLPIRLGALRVNGARVDAPAPTRGDVLEAPGATK